MIKMTKNYCRRFSLLIIIAISFSFLFSSPVKAQTNPVTETQLATANARLLQLNTNGQPNSASKIAELTRLAGERRALLLRAMREIPAMVLRYVFKQNITDSFPSAVQTLLEKEVSLNGDLETISVEKTDGSISRYRLLNVGENTFQLFSETGLALPDNLKTVTVSGFLLDGSFLLGEASKKSLVAAKSIIAPRPSLFGTKKLAVILFNFADDRRGTNQPFVADDLRREVFTNTDSVAAYYRENSFNQFNLTGDILGPYIIGKNKPNCDLFKTDDGDSLITSLSKIVKSVIDKARIEGVKINDYQYFVLAAPPFCGSDFRGVFAPETSAVLLNNAANPLVIAHELGHAFGLGHAEASDECTATNNQVISCPNFVPYGDPFSIMGHGDTGLLRQLNNFHKATLNWLDPNSTRTVTNSGVYELAPVEILSTKAIIRIPWQTYTGSYYYLEYRQPHGTFDNFSATAPVVNGISIRQAYDYDRGEDFPSKQTWLIDTVPATRGNFTDAPLTVGRSFQDKENNLTIEVLSADQSSARVRITFNETPQPNLWISDNPSFAFSVTPISVQTGGTVTLSNIKVMNDGDAPSGVFSIGLYLSNDTTISTTSDTLLQTMNLSSIGAKSFTSVSARTFTIPANTPAGNYYVGAIVDPTNVVKESNENDNALKKTPLTVTALPPTDITRPTIYLVAPAPGPTTVNKATNISIQAFDNIPRNVRNTSIIVTAPGIANALVKVCDNTGFQFLPAVATCSLPVSANQWVAGTIVSLLATDNSPNRNSVAEQYIVNSGQLTKDTTKKDTSNSKIIVPPAPTCHTFTANLSIGMSGSEVIALQNALTRAGFSVTVTGNFDEGTASAVSSFQLKYKNEILTANGLIYPTGYFSSATRQKMNSLWGCG
jgi:peptidoglycan hydrolase-like protein with peptidoglycan-binding domain